MNGTTILRGPFGGDQYTRIHNDVFRGGGDLSTNAIAVLGHISTHAEGWGISSRTVGRALGLSESTVRRALRELRAAHYVVAGQNRRADGRMGETWLFATDLPAQMRALGIHDETAIAAAVQEALDNWLENHVSAGQNRWSRVAGGGPRAVG